MKIAFRILIIIAITALVAGGIYLLVENTSIASGLESGQRQRGEFTKGERTDSERSGKMESGEGSKDDHDHGESASITRGLAQMGAALGQIGIITLVVLAIQSVFSRRRKRKTLASA